MPAAIATPSGGCTRASSSVDRATLSPLSGCTATSSTTSSSSQQGPSKASLAKIMRSRSCENFVMTVLPSSSALDTPNSSSPWDQLRLQAMTLFAEVEHGAAALSGVPEKNEELMEHLRLAVSRSVAKEVRMRLTRTLKATINSPSTSAASEGDGIFQVDSPLTDDVDYQHLANVAEELSSWELTSSLNYFDSALSTSSTASSTAPSIESLGSMFSVDSEESFSSSSASSLEAEYEQDVKNFTVSRRRAAMEKSLADQRLADYNRAMAILTQPLGMKVVKHNHNGGKSTRMLRYQPSSKCLMWRSSRLVGAERIQSWRIVKVLREEKIVYLWHMGKGVHGSEKKMVGFELKREADAAIMENALIYLKGIHS